MAIAGLVVSKKQSNPPAPGNKPPPPNPPPTLPPNKAYYLWSDYVEYGALVYAPTARKARQLGLDDVEYIETKARRLPEADKWAHEGHSFEHDVARWRALGWRGEDASECHCCGLSDFSYGSDPAWRVCVFCDQCGECDHADHCPSHYAPWFLPKDMITEEICVLMDIKRYLRTYYGHHPARSKPRAMVADDLGGLS